MGKITWTDRTDASTATGATTEVSKDIMNEIKTVVNANDDTLTTAVSDISTAQGNITKLQSSALGAITVSSITLDNSGYYNDLTISANTVLNFTGTPIEGTWQKVRTTGWNGSYTLSVPNNAVIVNSSFTQGGVVASGTYDLWFAYVGGEYQVNLVSVTVNLVAAPTIDDFTISNDNTYATFEISEAIYGANDASTPANLADFSFVFAANGGTATDFTVSSVKQADAVTEGAASELVGGETMIRAFGSLTGNADGNETLTGGVADGSSLYNAFGTPMDAGQSIEDNFAAEDITAPQFVTASFEVGNVADNIVVLPVDEALDPTSVPAVGDFAILVDASPNVVTNVDIATSSTQVRLTLTTSVTNGQTVTAAYTKGANPLRDVSLNETPSLTATAVTNNAAASQLTQPSGLVAVGANGQVDLTYDAIDANADDVAVQRSTTSGSGFSTIDTISRALTAYSDTTASNGTTYYYRLIANGSGAYSNSDPSDEAFATAGAWSTVYTSNFSAGVDSFAANSNGNVVGNIDGIGGVNDTLRLTLNMPTSTGALSFERTGIWTLTSRARVSFDIYFPSSNAEIDGFTFNTGAGGTAITVKQSQATDTWISVDNVEFDVTGNNNFKAFAMTGAGTTLQQSSNGDLAYIKNIVAEEI